MTPEQRIETQRMITDAIKMHQHDGVLTQRVNWRDIFGFIPTIDPAPTGVPLNILSQLIISNGNLQFYDFGNNIWRSSSGALFDHYTTVGNVTTGETDLYSDTTVPQTWDENGDKVFFEYAGGITGHATATRQIRVYIAGKLVCDSGSFTTAGNIAWVIKGTIISTGQTTARYESIFSAGSGLSVQTGGLTALDFETEQILKVTGQAGGAGAATNDIVATMGYVQRIAAA